MATNIVEVSEFTANCVTMEDGDPRDSASVLQATQPLTNRSRYIANYVPGIAGAHFVEIPLSVIGARDRFTATISPILTQDTVSTVSPSDRGEVWIPIGPLFVQGGAAELIELRVHLKGAPAHSWPIGGGNGVPTLDLFGLNLSTGVLASIGNQAFDPSGSAAAYQAAHSFAIDNVLGGLPETLSEQFLYFAKLTGEGGSNALAGLQIFGLRAKIRGL